MLTAGTKVGSYEIIGALGSGGMGDVYRGRDAALGRDVAIKVLAPDVAGDPDRLSRFAREARLLASLNHPNIASIYGLEQNADVHGLVLELVEGETLAARIGRGPLALKDALRIARDVAGALNAAHQKGIVHRDLKPGNVMLAQGGFVKVLDFGIAKVLAGDGGRAERSVTSTEPLTRAGTMIGTPAYMSPEQVRAQDVDTRTDLWALGCVLFEMLTGRGAFTAATVSDTIGRVLHGEPEWKELPASTPARLRHLLERCLAKTTADRWQDAEDLRFVLDDLLRALDGTATDDRESSPARRSPWRERVAWAIAGAIVAAIPVALSLGRTPPPQPATIAFTVPPPPGTTFSFVGGAPWPSISPDGRELAFVAVSTSGEQQLWLRTLDRADARPLSGTAGAYRPFWSPDSRSLGYFSDGRLWRVDLPDGKPQPLAAAPYSGDLKGAWGRDAIVVTLRTGFHRVPPTGGTPALLTDGVQRQEGLIDLDNHSFLPDGRRYVYLVNDWQQSRKYHCVGSLDPMPHTCDIALDAAARYAAPGYLLFVRDGVLRAQRFDPDRLTLSGEAQSIPAAHMANRESWQALPFSASSTGVLAYHPNTGEARLGWFDRKGAPDGSATSLDTYGEARLSADGNRLIFAGTNPATGDRDLWLHEIDRNRSSRFTFDPSVEPRAIFSSDGQQVVYRAGRGAETGLYVKAVNGAAQSLLALVHRSAIPRDWSSDHNVVLYQALDPKTGWDLWVVPTSGGGKPVPVVNSEHGEREGRFAPGGRYIAYDSTESGRREIWLQPFPATGARWQVSTGGGFSPRWRKDGKELFYIATDGRMMAVPVTLGTTPQFDAAVPLFPTLLRETASSGYDVAPDGRFLINLPPDGSTVKPITVILNWTNALRQ
jgi:eukaryotic-like serine/threonine-protein kinase